MGRFAAASAALVLALALAACDSPGPGTPESSGWREITGSPLSPRERALALWTGREVLLLGGSDDEPCLENADCPVDPTPRADGAALDPATGTWRRIADAPAGFTFAQGVVAGETAYVMSVSAGLLAYDITKDRWTRPEVPFDAVTGFYYLVAAGDRLVAHLTSDESDGGDDYLFDPRTARWSRLPADPLGKAFDRTMFWSGTDLVLFDKELIPNPNAEKPSVTRAAALDLAAGTWRTLPTSEILWTSPWFLDRGRLVNPVAGGSDGGEIGTWSHPYPNGGILDPATGQWSPLPDGPTGHVEWAGGFGESSAVYVEATGMVLDATTASWKRLPRHPDGKVQGRAVVAAGTDLLAFGGADAGGKLLSSTWVWSAR